MNTEKPDVLSDLKPLDNFAEPPTTHKQSPAMSAHEPYDGDTNPQHTMFCRMVGMPSVLGDTQNQSRPFIFPSVWNIWTRKSRIYTGLYPRVRTAYQWHTFQYWLVATTSNLILLLHISFGAALTALGATKSDSVSLSIVVLGALQTVFGGVATYYKSRNQPNRSRQFRISLKKVMDEIEDCEGMLRDPTYQVPSYVRGSVNIKSQLSKTNERQLYPNAGTVIPGVPGLVVRLMDMYTDAVEEAQANYPDFWLESKRTNDDDVNTQATMKDILNELKKSNGTSTTAPGTGSDQTGGIDPTLQQRIGTIGGGGGSGSEKVTPDAAGAIADPAVATSSATVPATHSQA